MACKCTTFYQSTFTRLVIFSEIYTAGRHRQALQVDPKFQNKLAETIIVLVSIFTWCKDDDIQVVSPQPTIGGRISSKLVPYY